MAKKGAKPAKLTRVSPMKPGLRGASRLVQSRIHAGLRSATLSRQSMLRFSSSVLLAFLALAFVALWLGGHLPTVRDNIGEFKRDRLMALGFMVERIDVTGEGRIHEMDVRAAIGIYEGDYFFGTDLDRAQSNTESLPWVDRAVVRRLWPNRIVVQLVETEPYALYQKDGRVYLTDRAGEVVAPFTAETATVAADLHLFIGQDAARHAEGISNQLRASRILWSQTKSLTRQPSGRWDIRLEDDRLVRLPETGLATALRRYERLARQGKAHFAIIDLRLPDRITVTPSVSPDA